jgi:hypothetical protein
MGISDIQLAAGTVDQRKQQANRQQHDERQPAKPASDSRSRYPVINLHRRPVSELARYSSA